MEIHRNNVLIKPYSEKEVEIVRKSLIDEIKKQSCCLNLLRAKSINRLLFLF